MTHFSLTASLARISRWSAMLAVSVCSACLLGGVRPEPAHKATAVAVVSAVQPVIQEAAVEAQPAAFTMHAEPATAGVELLHDATAEVPAARIEAPVRATKLVHPAVRNARTIWLQVTAYCPCKICCGPGARGLTASGHTVRYNHGRFVAADTRVLPFGTKLVIPGYANGAPVEVIDRGGAIKGHHIDLFFASHEQAKEWGVKWMKVTIVDDNE